MKTLSIILIVLSLLIFIGGMASATGAPQEASIAEFVVSSEFWQE